MIVASSPAISQNFDFGFGVTTGTKMKLIKGETTGNFTTGVGLNVRGVFNFANKFGILGGASYFLPSKYVQNDGTDIKNTFITSNVDFLFYFLNIPKIKVYGLGWYHPSFSIC